MLAGLDQVPWKRLSHACGRATDLPAILRALAAPEESVRQEALFELETRIHHQGSIYEATAAVVPFLYEMAQDSSMPDRIHVLYLLAGISEEWTPEMRDHQADPASTPLRLRAVVERGVQERPHRQAAHQAVEDGFPVLKDLLQDPDITVRIGAAFVLETLMDHGPQATAALLEMIDQDGQDWCRAAAICALSELAAITDPEHVSTTAGGRLRDILWDDGSGPDERLCAGLALLRFGHAEFLAGALALARRRLPDELEHFSKLPSSRHARNLVSLVTDRLHAWPEARVDWIGECLQHTDCNVIHAALAEAGALCREVRWGPSKFATPIAQLANSSDEKIRSSAISELGGLGRAGIRQLTQLLQHPGEEVRSKAAEVLPRTGSQITQPLTEWNESPPAELAAIDALRETIERYQGSPRWDDVEKVCQAIEQLAFHGPSAASARELIQRQLDHANTKIHRNPLAASQLRLTALRALWRITHEADKIVPQLIEALEPDRYGLLVIRQLRELGPAARDALPALRRMAESERRFVGNGYFTGCIYDDETFQAAAREAVCDIEK